MPLIQPEVITSLGFRNEYATAALRFGHSIVGGIFTVNGTRERLQQSFTDFDMVIVHGKYYSGQSHDCWVREWKCPTAYPRRGSRSISGRGGVIQEIFPFVFIPILSQCGRD